MKKPFASATLIALSLFYLIMLGGGNYEHLNVTAKVIRDMPDSLAMMKGDYGFNPIRFWVIFRPLTILLFLIAIYLHWKADSIKRNALLFAFGIDCIITLSTFLYFAPETELLMNAVKNESLFNQNIAEKFQQWELLNKFRLAGFYIVGITLLVALNHHQVKQSKN